MPAIQKPPAVPPPPPTHPHNGSSVEDVLRESLARTVEDLGEFVIRTIEPQFRSFLADMADRLAKKIRS